MKTNQAKYKIMMRISYQLKDYDYNLKSLDFRQDLNLWLLYVIKREVLTVLKLHRRNLAFEDLADYCEVESYDGWDAQKIKRRNESE